MNIVIIEDEPPAAALLKRMLTEIDPSLTIGGLIESVEGGKKWFASHPQPELAFVDIQLSDGLSFDLIESGALTCPVIFVTAFDEYAIRAFKVNSVDYLLKPIDPAELRRALDEFRKMRQSAVDLKSIVSIIREHRPTYRSRFLIPRADRFIAIEIGDVLFFASEKKKTLLIAKNGSHLELRDTLDELEEVLDPARFFRANRQHLVGYSAISGIHSYFNGKLKVYLRGETQALVVSKEKAGLFKKWLNR